jgi:hypothetical protein
MTTNFLIVAHEGKRPETEYDVRGKKLHKIKKELRKARKKKKEEGKHNRKKRKKGENSRKRHIKRRERSYLLLSLSRSLSGKGGRPLFYRYTGTRHER